MHRISTSLVRAPRRLCAVALVAAALSPVLSGQAVADSQPADEVSRQSDSIGCIVGGVGVGVALSLESIMIGGASAATAAAGAPSLASLVTAGVAAGCAVGAAATPGAGWILRQWTEAVSQVGMHLPLIGRKARSADVVSQ
jgi:hypothetical protein